MTLHIDPGIEDKCFNKLWALQDIPKNTYVTSVRCSSSDFEDNVLGGGRFIFGFERVVIVLTRFDCRTKGNSITLTLKTIRFLVNLVL